MQPKIEDYSRIERAILFLEENYHRQPELREVAQSVHLSEFHFQRLFRRWAGISPKRFIQFLTLEHAKKLLERVAQRARRHLRRRPFESRAAARPVRQY